MNKTLLRAASLVFVAAVALSACSNDESGVAQPSPEITVSSAPVVVETPEVTEAPETPEPAETTEAPAPGNNATNGPVEVIGINGCMPYIEAFLRIGELSNDMSKVEEPKLVVAAFTETSELLNGLDTPKGAEADFENLKTFYGFYSKNLQGATTTADVNSAMLKVLSDINASGMNLTDGITYAENLGTWMDQACV